MSDYSVKCAFPEESVLECEKKKDEISGPEHAEGGQVQRGLGGNIVFINKRLPSLTLLSNQSTRNKPQYLAEINRWQGLFGLRKIAW
jgi:hypothetical protein